MLAFVRGALPPRSFCCRPFPPLPPTSHSSATISPMPRSSSKPRSRPMPGRSSKSAAALRREADAAFQRNDFRTGMQMLGQIVAVAPERQRQLAAAGPHRPADRAPATTASARCCSSARRPPPTSPISARRNAGEEAESLVVIGRTFADRAVWRPALDALRLSLELREVAEIRAAIRTLRERSRLPPARLHGRCRRRLAARLLPVLRGAAGQAHRLLAVRGGRRPGQAGALGARTSSSASKASSTASATPSRCAPACRRS